MKMFGGLGSISLITSLSQLTLVGHGAAYQHDHHFIFINTITYIINICVKKTKNNTIFDIYITASYILFICSLFC